MARSRGFVFTLNNYTGDDEEYLQDVLQSDYIIYGREVGEQGTPHLQGYVYFKNARTLKSLFKLRKWHVEVAKADVLRNAEYCKKDDSWFEKGTRPLTANEKGKAEKRKWEDIKTAIIANDMDAIPADINLRYGAGFKRFRDSYRPRPTTFTDFVMIWLNGQTGTGKSTMVHTLFPDLYNKPWNQWWDGYEYEDVVLMDEACPDTCYKQAHDLKQLCDVFPVRVQYKGGSMLIRPKVIIFCSNYDIEQCFSPIDRDPMRRRAKQFIVTQDNRDAIRQKVLEAVHRALPPSVGEVQGQAQVPTGNVPEESDSSSEDDSEDGYGTSSEGDCASQVGGASWDYSDSD